MPFDDLGRALGAGLLREPRVEDGVDGCLDGLQVGDVAGLHEDRGDALEDLELVVAGDRVDVQVRALPDPLGRRRLDLGGLGQDRDALLGMLERPGAGVGVDVTTIWAPRGLISRNSSRALRKQ